MTAPQSRSSVGITLLDILGSLELEYSWSEGLDKGQLMVAVGRPSAIHTLIDYSTYLTSSFKTGGEFVYVDLRECCSWTLR